MTPGILWTRPSGLSEPGYNNDHQHRWRSGIGCSRGRRPRKILLALSPL